MNRHPGSATRSSTTHWLGFGGLEESPWGTSSETIVLFSSFVTVSCEGQGFPYTVSCGLCCPSSFQSDLGEASRRKSDGRYSVESKPFSPWPGRQRYKSSHLIENRRYPIRDCKVEGGEVSHTASLPLRVRPLFLIILLQVQNYLFHLGSTDLIGPPVPSEGPPSPQIRPRTSYLS